MKPSLPDGATVQYTHFRAWGAYFLPYATAGEVRRLLDEFPLEISPPEMPPLPKGGLTIAVVFDKDGNELSAGAAECSRLDNFCKRIGRDIALGRALKVVDVGA